MKIIFKSNEFIIDYYIFYQNSNYFKQEYPNFIETIELIGNYSINIFQEFLNFLINPNILPKNIKEILKLLNFWKCFELLNNLFNKFLIENENNHYFQLYLGDIYYFGYGLEINLEKSFYWYNKSANNNNFIAKYKLGEIYQNENFYLNDLNISIEWFKKSAFDGYKKAIKYFDFNDNFEILFNLVLKGYKKSFKILKKKLKNLKLNLIQFYFGIFYKNVNFVKKNFNKFLKFFIKSILNQNFPIISSIEIISKIKNLAENDEIYQYFLGYFFENGIGININYFESIYWYEKSSKLGFEESKKKLLKYNNNNYKLIQFKELEEFITFYNLNKELPTDINFIENQLIFLIKNIILMFEIRPFNNLIYINLI